MALIVLVALTASYATYVMAYKGASTECGSHLPDGCIMTTPLHQEAWITLTWGLLTIAGGAALFGGSMLLRRKLAQRR